jgi:hypothetical protein
MANESSEVDGTTGRGPRTATPRVRRPAVRCLIVLPQPFSSHHLLGPSDVRAGDTVTLGADQSTNDLIILSRSLSSPA